MLPHGTSFSIPPSGRDAVFPSQKFIMEPKAVLISLLPRGRVFEENTATGFRTLFNQISGDFWALYLKRFDDLVAPASVCARRNSLFESGHLFRSVVKL